MKKLACFLIMITLLVTASCKKIDNYAKFSIAQAESYAQIDQENAIKEGLEGYLNFTTSLFNNTEGQNKLIAPLSAYTALGMALNGASGNTLTQMENALGGKVGEINEFCLANTKSIEKVSKTKVFSANSVWLKDSYSEFIKKDYLSTLSNYYSPEIFCLPFNTKLQDRVNNWVYNHTDGGIKKLMDKPPASQSRMLLVNASFISGKWTEQAKKTHKTSFFNQNGSTVTVDYISGKSALYYSKNAYAIRRYLEGSVYFTAILPIGDYEEYKNNLSVDELMHVCTDINPRGSTYELPVFETDFSYSLKPALTKMGMQDAFSDVFADFSKITEHPSGLYVDSAEQKTKIQVTKNGLEASAAIKIDFGAKSSAPLDEPLHLKFDRPFIYMVNLSNGVPLFIGCVESL